MRKKSRFGRIRKFIVNKKPTVDKQDIKKSFGTVTFKNGTYSAAAIAVVIVIAIVLNLLAGRLPENAKEMDISGNRIYEISKTTKELMKSLDHEIKITVVAEDDNIDDMLKTFLDRYEALSKKITVKTVDPVLHPSALTEYETEADTIVVSCEDTGQSQIIYFTDILVQDMYSYYYSGSSGVTAFDGDGQLTSAISRVIGQETKTAYFVSGHGEASPSDSIVSLLNKSGVDSASVELYMTEEIPSDCDVLIFNGPTSDISDGEKTAVDNYIKSGGSVMILVSESTPVTGNISTLMKGYEITLEDGYIADMERNYMGSYYTIFPNVTDYAGVAGELNTGTVMVSNSRGFTLGESSEEITVDSIMETSSYGYLVRTEDDMDQGTFVTAAAATYTAAGESDDETVTGNLVVFGSNTLIDESLTGYFSNLDNNTLFSNTVISILGDVQNLSIEAKSLEIQYNTVQNNGSISIFLIFILPVGILLAGFVLWYRRRKA